MDKTRCCFALCLLLSACSSGADSAGPGPGGKADDVGGELPEHLPKRIILLIGDGMGPAHVTGAAYLANHPLHMLGMEQMGFQATHEHEYVTTDSAAAASAMASGEKTHFEGVGVEPGTTASQEEDADHHFDTVIDVAQRVEWKTGLVVTTSVVDATPAGFGAHRAKRASKDGIAEDLRHSNIDVLIGGGTRWFEDRPDGQNLLSQMRDDGYSVATTRTGLRRVASRVSKLIALLSEQDMPALDSGERPVLLAEMTKHALSVLDRQNDDGFFLMVEGSWIDRESHSLDGPASLGEVIDFDDAVGVALEYASQRDDTLVVVTADHETGGLAIVDPGSAQSYIDVLGGDASAEDLAAFAASFGPPPYEHLPLGGVLGPTDGELTTAYGYLSLASRPHFTGPGFVFSGTHSATMVPIFASGPAAEFVTSIRDNADLGAVLKRVVLEDGGTGSPAPAPPPETPENVIVVITDGVGLPALSAGQYAGGLTKFRDFPVSGFLATHASDALVSDVGAAATSLATGALADAGALGGSSALQNWFERADDSGMDTAIVTTASLASPALAGLLTHEDGGAVAGQISTFGESTGSDGLDVLFAGGRASLSAAELDAWRARGAQVETSWSTASAGGSTPVIRLIVDDALPPARERLMGSGPTLEEMTRVALDGLEARNRPFLLAVYADGVRRAADSQERDGSFIDELSDLDGALQVALSTAARRGDTAVVVLSLRDSTLSLLDNHYGFHKGHCGVALRCGGTEDFTELPVAVGEIRNDEGFSNVALQGDFSPIGVILQFAWHLQVAGPIDNASTASANFVPLFGAGPGTGDLEGFSTLAEVGAIVGGWVTRTH